MGNSSRVPEFCRRGRIAGRRRHRLGHPCATTTDCRRDGLRQRGTEVGAVVRADGRGLRDRRRRSNRNRLPSGRHGLHRRKPGSSFSSPAWPPLRIRSAGALHECTVDPAGFRSLSSYPSGPRRGRTPADFARHSLPQKAVRSTLRRWDMTTALISYQGMQKAR